LEQGGEMCLEVDPVVWAAGVKVNSWGIGAKLRIFVRA